MANKRVHSQVDECLADSAKKRKQFHKDSNDSNDLNYDDGKQYDSKICQTTDRTELDSLVLENCASQIFWPHRIHLESVSRRFADALQTTYKDQPIFVKLAINRPADFRPGYGIHCFNSSMRKTVRILVYEEEQLKKKLHLLCSRFKQFQFLSIDATNGHLDWNISTMTQCVLDAVANSDCFPTKVDQLKYRLDRQSCDYDWRLIERFSKLVKKLTVYSHSFGLVGFTCWCKKIESCSKLRTLEFFPETDIPPSHGLILLNCLQTLKIRRFRISTHSLPLDWLPMAFANNDDLQTLHIKSPTSELGLTLFTSLTLLPIVGKLHCLEFDSNKRITQPYRSAEIIQLVRAMKLDAHFKVYHKVDCSSFDYSSDALDNREETARILRFWLDVSQQSGRELNLCLIFSWDIKRNINNALAFLKSYDSYSNVILERVEKRTLLRYHSAVIALSIIAWHDYESGLKASHVW